MPTKVNINRRPVASPIENVELTYHLDDKFLVLKRGTTNFKHPWVLEAHATPFASYTGSDRRSPLYCHYNSDRLSEFAHAILQFIGEE